MRVCRRKRSGSSHTSCHATPYVDIAAVKPVVQIQFAIPRGRIPEGEYTATSTTSSVVAHARILR
jgi:hypothetical protein